MKGKIDFRIPIIIILIFILVVMCIFYFKNDNVVVRQTKNNNKTEKSEITSNNATETTSSIKSINATAQVISAVTDKIELNTTYYLQESYVEKEQAVAKGENILQYTNGTYLTAPYDCIIKTMNIPEAENKCTNQHYIEVESTDLLAVQFKVDETNISKISLEQDAQVKISALDDKTLSGTVTNITNTASNGKFTVTVQFENDGEVKLGMSASVSI